MVSANPPWRHQYYTPEGLKLNPHLKWGLLTLVITSLKVEGIKSLFRRKRQLVFSIEM